MYLHHEEPRYGALTDGGGGGGEGGGVEIVTESTCTKQPLYFLDDMLVYFRLVVVLVKSAPATRSAKSASDMTLILGPNGEGIKAIFDIFWFSSRESPTRRWGFQFQLTR